MPRQEAVGSSAALVSGFDRWTVICGYCWYELSEKGGLLLAPLNIATQVFSNTPAGHDMMS